MQDIFKFHRELIGRYNEFSQGFNIIREADIRDEVNNSIDGFCPEPLIQMNMNYKRGGTVGELVRDGTLHPACERIFARDGKPLTLYCHQQQAILRAKEHKNYVLTTGTGSGKSLTFIIPIIDDILRAKEEERTPRTRAIIIYPMNALANSQLEEFKKYLGNAEDVGIKVRRYTGQESDEDRREMAKNPPDILLTNYMMLEYLLTRSAEDTDRKVIENCRNLSFLVLDELHTYRGRQGADVAMLVRRLRITTESDNMLCVGTSATMSSATDADERRRAVAKVAYTLFGDEVSTDGVIEEQLVRVTDTEVSDDELPTLLKNYLQGKPEFDWTEHPEDIRHNPLAIWVERNIGSVLTPDNELRRAEPKSVTDYSEKLAEITDMEQDETREILQEFLRKASDVKVGGRTPFAFKLHQFISAPGTVCVSLEPPEERLVTLKARSRARKKTGEDVPLFTAYFCAECGQAHIPAWYYRKEGLYTPRNLDDDVPDGDDDKDREIQSCILTPVNPGVEIDADGEKVDVPHYFDPKNIKTLPESWSEETKDGSICIKKNRAKYKPEEVFISAQGEAKESSEEGVPFFKSHHEFLYCVHCGAEFNKNSKIQNRLFGLSIEGRSSATTALTLAAINLMQEEIRNTDEPTLKEELRKMCKILGFTDNRQDAALQAGFFNDFVHDVLLRAALIRALSMHPGEALDEFRLVDALQDALGVKRILEGDDIEQKACILEDPKSKGSKLSDALDALRFYLGYSLLAEQRESWRRNNPGPEQLNVLTVTYQDVDDVVEEASISEQIPVWAKLTHDSKVKLFTCILDYLRKKLCIDSIYLNGERQREYQTKEKGKLTTLWNFPEGRLTEGKVAYFSAEDTDSEGVSLGSGSKIVKELSEYPLDGADREVWRDNKNGFGRKDCPALIRCLFEAAENYGIVERGKNNTWVLDSRAIRWSLTSGKESKQQNGYFLRLYKRIAKLLEQPDHELFGLEAAEHTAQVDSENRQKLEKRFRHEKGLTSDGNRPLPSLPLLFCSPTMELGVDISSLDIVFMRNVPPTPANYAQRAGRAGRSGHAALAITYCAANSPHDQWFFHKQGEMVHGIVHPPAPDLSNRDMVDSHIRAIWLHAANYQLDGSIAEILDTEKDDLPIRASVQAVLRDSAVVSKARAGAEKLMASIRPFIPKGKEFDWAWDPDYCQTCLEKAWDDFNEAFEMWRELYLATKGQMKECSEIKNADINRVTKRYIEAIWQMKRLENKSSARNEFYTYRYLAGQGFIPGYDFPRLPLIAWIPPRRENEGESIISRPRFFALSEFGPMSLIYHRGSIYQVDRIKLPAQKNQIGSRLPTHTIQICPECGHSCLVSVGNTKKERCEICNAELKEPDDSIYDLYKMNTVETRRRERINSTMEERLRQGYELQTCYRFATENGHLNCNRCVVCDKGQPDEEKLGSFTYGASATLWRINKGWTRRADHHKLGFRIDPFTGRWTSDAVADSNKEAKPGSAFPRKITVQTIVPYVDDSRNILIYKLPERIYTSVKAVATLQAALVIGIVHAFQIESSEIMVEALPNRDNRRSLLLYEASEGGAGVLHQLLESPDRLKQVAEEALHAMHYREEGNRWIDTEEEEPDPEERCSSACYRCLLSYRNQPDHSLIDRHDPLVCDLLVGFACGRYTVEPEPNSVESADSPLRQRLSSYGLPAPDAEAKILSGGAVVADAWYNDASLAIFCGAIPPEAASLEDEMGIFCCALPDNPSETDIMNIKKHLPQ